MTAIRFDRATKPIPTVGDVKFITTNPRWSNEDNEIIRNTPGLTEYFNPVPDVYVRGTGTDWTLRGGAFGNEAKPFTGATPLEATINGQPALGFGYGGLGTGGTTNGNLRTPGRDLIGPSYYIAAIVEFDAAATPPNGTMFGTRSDTAMHIDVTDTTGYVSLTQRHGLGMAKRVDIDVRGTKKVMEFSYDESTTTLNIYYDGVLVGQQIGGAALPSLAGGNELRIGVYGLSSNPGPLKNARIGRFLTGNVALHRPEYNEFRGPIVSRLRALAGT